MDGYTSAVNSWRQDHLDDESILCLAPSPSNPDDIICPGSDQEADGATKASKYRRYEEHGRRYLQGRPLRIFSASLRGPFDRASGWQNPWLPKPSPQYGQGQDPTRPWPVPSVSQDESGVAVVRLSSEQSDTDQDLDDSMECHLPSPQSHDDLQLSETPSKFKSRSRIASWAKNVPDDILEEDEFWAPDRLSTERNFNSAKKHSADRDWLKRRPAKRNKLHAPQSTEPTSTPTPLPTARPRLKSKKPSAIRSKSVAGSFEMTTPSSSPGKEPKESPDPVARQAVNSYEKNRQPVPSTTSARDSRISSEPPLQCSRDEEEIEGKEREHKEEHAEEEYENKEEAHTAGTSGVCPRQFQEQTSHSDEGTEDNINFQDCADESFCYQARHIKQITPLAASNAIVADCPSPHTQTEVPISAKHGDAVTVSPCSNTRECSPNAGCSYSDVNNAERSEKLTECSIAVTLSDESEYLIAATSHSDLSAPQYDEKTFRSCGIIDMNRETNCASKAKVDQPLGDITSSQHASRLNIGSTTPQTVQELKTASSTNIECFLDEDPTLIGDPMDTEELENMEPTRQDPGNYLQGTSLLQHYAISATNLANAGKLFQCGNSTTLKKVNDAVSSTTATITQQGPAEFQSEPIGRCSQKEERANSAVSSDATVSHDGKDISNLVAEGQTISIESQSPWAPQCAIRDSHQLGSNNDIELAEDRPRELTAQATTMLLSSPVSIHYSPAIHPSQQSPWVKEITEPANETRLEGAGSMNAVAIVDIELGQFQNPLLPVNQEHLSSFASSPSMPPVPESSSQIPREQQDSELDIVTEKGCSLSVQNVPYTPIPQNARQSTPDGEVSIRSFSNFNFSSPRQSDCPPGSSTGRGILSGGKCPSIRTSMKLSKRVSFAPSPCEEEGDSQPSTKLRAVSPPPPLADLDEENIDGLYRNHFDAMNRRLSALGIPNPRYHQRLLPSSSQQKPESPSIGAMAEAFRQADAQLLDHVDDTVKRTKIDGLETKIEVIKQRPQSPWRHDSQGIDDVAAVMGNLTDFLDVWDVDTEMDRNRTELAEAESLEVPANNDMSILQGVGIW
ncbi:hypothetical protein F4803DRAFT_533379 [Xylaria telfairii]|nr:hypothetical protein F4803DRAFT_533379 [Xylaria telfairii]